MNYNFKTDIQVGEIVRLDSWLENNSIVEVTFLSETKYYAVVKPLGGNDNESFDVITGRLTKITQRIEE